MNTLTFAPFLEAPDRPFLSPTKIAKALHLQLGELAAAAGVHRDTLTACPESPRVQAFLRDTLRVLNETQGTISPEIPPIAWMLNEPLSAFRQRTAWELVEAGRTDVVLKYLHTYSAGFVG